MGDPGLPKTVMRMKPMRTEVGVTAKVPTDPLIVVGAVHGVPRGGTRYVMGTPTEQRNVATVMGIDTWEPEKGGVREMVIGVAADALGVLTGEGWE